VSHSETLLKPAVAKAWEDLQAHHESTWRKTSRPHLRDLFAKDASRTDKLSLSALGIYFDYSKHLITEETIQLLLALANQVGLRDRIEQMFRGEKINNTENRAVLHVALRAPRDRSILVNGVNVVPQVHAVLDQMTAFANRVRSGEWKGHTGKPIRTIVNIGIGGSDLGPVMAYEALRHYTHRQLTFRFVSNIDGTDFVEATRDLNPEETLFIVASKTFTTQETMTNARTAREWLLKAFHNASAAVAKHFVAVSTSEKEVREFGIDTANMFGFWDWVGGRYSMDSAIGLSTMLAIGPDAYREMLNGFHEMDEHYRTAPFEKNLPVLMALLDVWYVNFMGAETKAILPYDQYLKRFAAYLQQLMMESLGKSVKSDGTPVTHETGAIIWGEPGTNGQHSFYQLIHQGTKLIPVDFIGFARSLNPTGEHHDLLMSNMMAQSAALAFGKTREEVTADNVSPELAPHRVFEGNRPSSTILIDQMTPAVLGKLVALYEHITATQSFVWGINAFDQWGVELGKKMAGQIAPVLQGAKPAKPFDASTAQLITRYKELRNKPA